MKAGLKQGDIVHSIDDAEVSTWLDIVEIIQENPGIRSLSTSREMTN